MRTVALIGDPVEHSPSPAMHRAAAAATDVELEYVAERVKAEELPDTFPGLRDRFAGLNVTIPLKEAIVDLLDEVRGEGARTGSVNTVVFADGRAIGDSTDGAGFLAALQNADAPEPSSALILGAGGAARAVAAALRSSGAPVTLAARDHARATAVASAIGARAIPLDPAAIGPAVAQASLLVNATPLGGAGHEGSPLPAGVDLHDGLTVFDLVYRPRVTRLLADARDHGCRTVEGVEMLVEQGARSFELWTGVKPPIDVMRDAALAHLEARV